MTTFTIIQTIVLSIISLIGGIVIGIALVVNKLNKTTPTQDSYNNFLKKQVKI